MRAALWPDAPSDQHRGATSELLDTDLDRETAFVALGEDGEPISFAEAALC